MPKIVELKRKNSKNFEMYPNFNDVDREEIKVWNRCVTYFNVMKDVSIEEGNNYARQFSLDDRKKMIKIIEMIKEQGLDNVKSRINRNEFTFL